MTHLVALLLQEIARIDIDVLQQQDLQFSMPLGLCLRILILFSNRISVGQESRQLPSERLEYVSSVLPS